MTTPMHQARSPATTVIPVQLVPRAGAAPRLPQPACSDCHLRDLCLPAGLQDEDVERLDALLFARRRVRADEPLFHQGEAFQFVYAVRSGMFKTTLTMRDGREQVSGFHLPGDLLGFEGLATGRHAATARALEDAQVCAIPYAQLSALARGRAPLREVLTRIMSREIVREHAQVSVLAGMSAEERLAWFLLNLSRRSRTRGWSASEFHLRMSRAEIGSYLGVTLETVSRTFSSFQQRGLLQVRKKHLRIDARALEQAYEVHLQ